MPKRLLPFIPPSLRVVAVTPEPERVTVLAVPRSTEPCCPACHRRSDRTHGHYERRLADLPWQGRSVSLRVRLRRLCCRNPACSRRTFSESLSDVAVPRARRSRRLQDVQRHLGLRRHPGVEIVARDRAEVYGEGVRQGAPEAMHVLDRWHLLRNLGEALQEAVTGQHVVIRAVARTLGDERAAALRDEQNRARPVTAIDQRKLAKHTPRRARHAELLRLHAAGASVAGIARHLDLDRKTVRRWLRRDGPPTWAKPPRPSVIDPYRTYLDRRWSEGCRNAAALARELDRLGARIKPRVVRAWATARRRAGADTRDRGIADAPRPWKAPATRRIARLLQCDAGTIAGADGVFIERLRHRAPSLAGAADLAVRLTAMLRGQSTEAVEDWLRAARSSALKRFAASLQGHA